MTNSAFSAAGPDEPQAGSLCKKLGNENLAFVLLNRYVDLTEAIDEGNASLLDNSDFAEATNVSLLDDSNLPTKQVRAHRELPLGTCPSTADGSVSCTATGNCPLTEEGRGRKMGYLEEEFENNFLRISCTEQLDHRCRHVSSVLAPGLFFQGYHTERLFGSEGGP